METTFYEESRYRGGGEPRGMKRPATLDLEGAVRNSKKARGASSLLTSPDMHLLKLESPELEKLIIQQHGLVGSNPAQCMYPKGGDDREQQQYPRDFPDVLGGVPHQANLHLYQQQPPHSLQSDLIASCNMPPSSTIAPVSIGDTYHHHGGYHQQPLTSININCNPMVSSTMASSSNCYGSVGGYYGGMESLVAVKEEPQTVPCSGPSPPQSPINMEDQELMKLERKRLRNRIAASKCRRRKLERIARLEEKVARLKSENTELTNHVTRLRNHVCQLKQQVMDHVRSGCEMMVSSTSYPSYGDDL